MHNVNTDALGQTVAKAEQDPSSLKQHVSFDGDWQTGEGEPQFRALIPVPNGQREKRRRARAGWPDLWAVLRGHGKHRGSTRETRASSAHEAP